MFSTSGKVLCVAYVRIFSIVLPRCQSPISQFSLEMAVYLIYYSLDYFYSLN